jgi:adenylate kinase family enzyme
VARVHVLGASGTGTTTLGRALAVRLGCPHLDTDDYFWQPTDPPFRQKRERAERQARLVADLAAHAGWVLSGSLCGWGDRFIPLFELVVFLSVSSQVRLARLRARERQRYGDGAIGPGGRLHADHVEFMTWAAAYDDGGVEIRSRALHEQWLAALPCRVLRLDGAAAIPTLVEQVGQALA